MAGPELDILTGVSFTFVGGTILATRKIIDVTLPGAEIEVFDASDQSTTPAKVKIAADIYDCGTFEFTVQHQQDDDIYAELGGVLGVPGAIVLALPHTGSSLAFDGIFQSYKPQNTPFNEPMLADVVIAVSGDITPTAGA